MPQKSAICVKVSAVFSISHTAVAFGINGNVMARGYDNRPRVGQGRCRDYAGFRMGGFA